MVEKEAVLFLLERLYEGSSVRLLVGDNMEALGKDIVVEVVVVFDVLAEAENNWLTRRHLRCFRCVISEVIIKREFWLDFWSNSQFASHPSHCTV